MGLKELRLRDISDVITTVDSRLRDTHARAMQNVLQVHAEFLKYEEHEQIDSGGGGALSQAAGHDGSFYGYDV